MSNIPQLGSEAERLLRVKFEDINHLDSEQSERGQFGYLDQKVNNDWLTFRSGAINMLKVQRDLVAQ